MPPSMRSEYCFGTAVVFTLCVRYFHWMLTKIRTSTPMLREKLYASGLMFGVLLAVLTPRSAHTEEWPVVRNDIPSLSTFRHYARQVLDLEVGKFLIDLHGERIIYFDVNVYPLHFDFVRKKLRGKPFSARALHRYYANYGAEKPDFILGYITHHRRTDSWDFSFWENDRLGKADVLRAKKYLDATFFQKELPWRPDSTLQEGLATFMSRSALHFKVVTNDSLYRAASFTPLNRGRAIGVLRIIEPVKDADTLVPQVLEVSAHDILLLQSTLADIPPVAGILSSVPSTPLSHVNLRARAWGVPNASFKGALKNYRQFEGKTVFYEVKNTQHTLRLAFPDEVRAQEEKRHYATRIVVPSGDLSIRALRALRSLRRSDVRAYGAKAANLGHIVRRVKSVPEGFAIPFAYYHEHLRRYGLIQKLQKVLENKKLISDAAWRSEQLKSLRHAIRAAPMDTDLLKAVVERVALLPRDGVFVRSSTNAEDLHGFNGAGLYDTVPNVRDSQSLEQAIKQVWASLWNERAVLERQRSSVDHTRVYSGVLIQEAIPATAAGVLVTVNLYDPADDHSYTLNAQHGLGMRVVEGNTIPEQVIFDIQYTGARVISRSDETSMLQLDATGGLREVPVRPGRPVLSERNVATICGAVQSFRTLFRNEYALDVEWVLENDKVWIVQVRPLVGAAP